MIKACNVLSIGSENVRVVDDKNLQDGPLNKWSPALILEYIQEEIDKNGIEEILTFDEGGASSHPNHIAVFHAASLLATKKSKETKIFFLKSWPTLLKFWGPLPLFFHALWTTTTSLISSRKKENTNQERVSFLNADVWRVVEAMKAHHSQFVWFRKLFVFFSSYSYFNSLSST
mmetsp:Transcript_30405/g.41947  ORF Transcript_30405/g.41947 Transcript_30405/m.41947 type:complete len:174 (+) Transcript_30405:416-937(+)